MQFIVRSLTFTMSMGGNTSASTHAYTWLFSKSNKRRTFFSTYDFNKQKQNKKTSFTKWLFSMKSGKCLRNGEKNPQEFYDNLLAALLSTCLWSVIRQLSRIFRVNLPGEDSLLPCHPHIPMRMRKETEERPLSCRSRQCLQIWLPFAFLPLSSAITCFIEISTSGY